MTDAPIIHPADELQRIEPDAAPANVLTFAGRADRKPDTPPAPNITATPFEWGDPRAIPPRRWVYPGLYVRKFVTGTVAPGGVGKTGLGLVECMAMACGRDLLDDGLKGDPRRTWYWCGEDPLEEMQRQVHAAALHYELTPTDFGNRLFVGSGREVPIRIAHTDRHGFKVDDASLDAIKATIRANGIDVAVFDPLVQLHKVPENSNEAMDAVVKALAQVANDCDCAIGVAAHTRKPAPGMEVNTTAGDARGGSALVDGARIIRVINRMTSDEADKAGVPVEERRRYVWTGGDGEKDNLNPPATSRKWRFLASVHLPNGPHGTDGDNMRVVAPWKWPDPLDGLTVADLDRAQAAVAGAGDRVRESVQSPLWVGHVIGGALGLDTGEGCKAGECTDEQKRARAKVGQALSVWIANGAFVRDRLPSKGKDKSREVPVIVVGETGDE